MTYLFASICPANSKQPVEEAHKIETVVYCEKIALITDVFLGALAVAAAVLVILATRGVGLGPISSIGSLGMKAAYVLVGFAGALFAADTLKLIIRMASTLSQLFEENTNLKKAKGSEPANSDPATQEKLQAKQEIIDALLKDITTINVNGELANMTQTKEHAELLNQHIRQIEASNLLLINEKNQLSSANSQLEQQKLQLETDKREAVQELAEQTQKATQEKQDAVNAKAQELQLEIDKLNTEITNLREQIKKGATDKDVIALNTTLENKNKELLAQLKTQATLDELNRQLDEKKVELDTKKQEITDKKTELDTLMSNALLNKGEIEKSIEKLKKEIEADTPKLAALKLELDKLVKEEGTLSDKVGKLKYDALSALQTKGRLEEEAKKNVAEMLKNAELPKKQIEDSIKELELKKAPLEEEIRKLEARIQANKEYIEEISKASGTLMILNSDFESQVADLKWDDAKKTADDILKLLGSIATKTPNHVEEVK